MATLITTPGVRIVLDTYSSGTIDVTEDIERGTLSLNENNYHSLSFTLSNPNNKYAKILTPNDRVVVQLKRMQWLQVFSGYLDVVPYFSVWQRSVDIKATCTLKRLRFHFWDPGLPASLDLVSGALGDQSTSPDGGMSNVVFSLLTQVANWPPDQIHQGEIPTDWMAKIAAIYSQEETALQAIADSLGPGQTSGQSTGSGSGSGTTPAGSLTFDQIVQLWVNAGGDPGWANLAAAIALAESGGNSTALNNNPSTGDYSVGLWQINYYDGLSASRTAAYGSPSALQASASLQAKAAVNLSGNGSNWGPWRSDRGWAAWVAAGSPSKPTKSQVYSWGLDFLGTQTSAPTTTPGASSNPPATTPATAPANTTGGIEAADYAISLIGVPYAWGGASPSGVDCSGLVLLAWSKAGVNLPHYTGAQIALCTPIQASQLAPGDLGFCSFSGGVPGHVGMYVGNDSVVSAPDTGQDVSSVSVTQWLSYFPDTQWARVPGYTPGSGSLNQPLNSDSSGGGSSTTSSNGGQTLIDGFWFPNSEANENPISSMLTGLKAFMNDTPLLPTITALVQTSLRSYCSAPNGDFITWFPDYFGQYGFAAKWYLSPLEMEDFQISWSDQQLVTHQFTSGVDPTGDTSPVDQGPSGTSVTGANLVLSQGVATIDVPGLFDALFNVSSTDQGLFGNVTAIYQQFGPRPNFQALPLVANDTPIEFWYALRLWQENWAKQFSANINTTFLPEVWPGMLLVIQEADMQCYITGVTHSWDLSESGGFQTQISVIAPSALDGSGLIGLARGG